MNILVFLITLLVGIVGGFAISNLVRHKIKKDDSEVENTNQHIDCAECDLDYFMEEWKVTIQTQMHFNDLIIKFRSIVLSVVIGISTISIAMYKNFGFTEEILIIILIGVFFFWICCFLLDYGYYHQLLMGSVKHAEKFDNNDFFKERGLLGLTNRISLQVKHYKSNALIIGIYFVPMILLLIVIIWKFDGPDIVHRIMNCLKLI